MNIKTLFVCMAVIILFVGTAQAVGRIEIETFSCTPTQFERNGAFELRVAVKASDVPLVSYVLRTSKPAAPEDAPAGFDYYDKNRKLAFKQENGQVHLQDNGEHDLDPKDHIFKIRIDTRGWALGKHDLVLFAHNRPGTGNHIKDYRMFFVWVEEKGVRVIDQSSVGETHFTNCTVYPAKVVAGDQVTLHVAWEGTAAEGIEVRQPYYVRPEFSPTPFTYDAKHNSILLEKEERLIRDNGRMDTAPESGTMAIPFDTTGWLPGLYHLELRLPNYVGASDLRHTVIKVSSPENHLEVQVSPSWSMMPGTHAERMSRMADGTLVHSTHLSIDGGLTWQARETGTIGSGCLQLRDGSVLGMDYRKLPIEGREGWYSGNLYLSSDAGKTVTVNPEGQFYVPQAKAAHGHAPHPGPLYMRSIVERPDGSLVALMAGWFKGDDEPCPYNPRRPYSRTYTCESKDGGVTWHYLSTIGYDHIGSEGYNEGAMEMLPDGRLIAVVRTGSMRDPKCQDNPIMLSISDDGGATWSTPQRTGMHGAFPDLLVLSDGMLALSYGRPGANIAFSKDKGTTWTDHTPVDPTPYSGYTSICEVAPGEILMAFGTKDRVDTENGELSNGIRMTRILYQEQALPLAIEGVKVSALGEGFYDCSMYSDALGREEKFSLHLPSGYAPKREKPYSLIVFLHGSGRHHRSLFEFPEAREAILKSPAIFLSPKGAQSWWVDSPVNTESRYASFLEECIALVSDQLQISQKSKQRAIGGWSMGGFGSANYAMQHPEDFGAWGGIVALLDFPNPQYPAAQNHSVPAILGNAQQQATFNPMQQVDKLKGMRIIMITADVAFDYRMNVAFSEELTQLGISHNFETLKGDHTIDVVLQAFPQVMDFFHTGFQH